MAVERALKISTAAEVLECVLECALDASSQVSPMRPILTKPMSIVCWNVEITCVGDGKRG